MNSIKKLISAGLLFCIVLSIQVFAEQRHIELPEPQKEGGMPLMEVFALRRSQRNLSQEALSDQMLSSLLWAATGENRPNGYRTVPSARNWRGIDVYVAREDGLFLYQPDTHRLLKVKSDDVRSKAGRQAFVHIAPVVLVYVADHSRMKDVSPETVQFYSATDTGFISQNVYLFCAANDLATVVIGSVPKDTLKQDMGLSENQHIVLAQPVGHPERE
jgi:SagB-type dehydrogenase family enzyme